MLTTKNSFGRALEQFLDTPVTEDPTVEERMVLKAIGATDPLPGIRVKTEGHKVVAESDFSFESYVSECREIAKASNLSGGYIWRGKLLQCEVSEYSYDGVVGRQFFNLALRKPSIAITPKGLVPCPLARFSPPQHALDVVPAIFTVWYGDEHTSIELKDPIGRTMLWAEYTGWSPSVPFPVLDLSKLDEYLIPFNLYLGYARAQLCRVLDIPYSRSPFRAVGLSVPTAGHLYSSWASSRIPNCRNLFSWAIAYAHRDAAGGYMPLAMRGDGAVGFGRFLHSCIEYDECLRFIRSLSNEESAGSIDHAILLIKRAKVKEVDSDEDLDFDLYLSDDEPGLRIRYRDDLTPDFMTSKEYITFLNDIFDANVSVLKEELTPT